jgi:hypothetical protein
MRGILLDAGAKRATVGSIDAEGGIATASGVGAAKAGDPASDSDITTMVQAIR